MRQAVWRSVHGGQRSRRDDPAFGATGSSLMRRIALLLVGLAGAALVVHAAAWMLVAEAVRAGLESPGPGGETLSHRGLGLSGWPGPVVRPVEAPRLTRPPDTLVPGVVLQAERAEARVSLLSPREVRVSLVCPCRLEATDRPGASAVMVDAERLWLELWFEGDGSPPRWRLEGRDLALVAGGMPVGVAVVRVEGERREAAEPWLTLLFALEGVRLPAAATPFGPVIRSLAGELALSGRIEPTLPAEAALRRWRDSEGLIELRRLSLAWGPVAASAGLSLTLDRALQPTGAGTLRLANWRATIDALQSSGALSRQAAALARLGLGAVARPPPGGGASVVDVPLALENRTLSAAMIPLLEVPPVAWPR